MKNFITFTAKRDPVLLKKIWASHAEKLLEKQGISGLMENWDKVGLTWLQNDSFQIKLVKPFRS